MTSHKTNGRVAGKATSMDIAYLAGVSQPTVSRALRGSPWVREETRQRVQAIAQQLNYKVDKNASNLRCQRSNTLALLLFEDPTPDDSQINPFFHSMLGSITRACARNGYDLLISFQQQSSNWHEDYEDTHKAAGLITLGYGDYLEYRARTLCCGARCSPVSQGCRSVRTTTRGATTRPAICSISVDATSRSWGRLRASIRSSSSASRVMHARCRTRASWRTARCRSTRSPPSVAGT